MLYLHMRRVLPICLLLVALIHAIPAAGLLSPKILSLLYGFSVTEPNLELALRHRAALFGLLACFLVYASFNPSLHRVALVAGFASVLTFLALASFIGPLNQAMRGVVRADFVALVLLCLAAFAHLRPIGEA
jgi:hypothetical protein